MLAIRAASASDPYPPAAANSASARAYDAIALSRSASVSDPIACSALRSRAITGSSPRADRMRFLASTSRSPVRGSCGKYPTSPLRLTVPAAGCASPARIRVNVVFPAPFRPTSPILSPGATWKEACSSSSRAPARTSNSRATSIQIS